MNIIQAKACLDKIIAKARVHLYKPIQVAEILYRDRISQDIDLTDLETYRTPSRRWRDEICLRFIGRASTSSARYQDDLFNANATPPECLVELGKENRRKGGIVEAYVYRKLYERHNQMYTALSYCTTATPETFSLEEFLALFWNEPGLRRSLDKLYEIIVYALFEILVRELGITVEVSLDENKLDILAEFEDFAEKVLGLTEQNHKLSMPARFHRVGVTNAADRGLDMWANYGPAVQIKHLSLNESMAESIVNTVTADRIVIVCKESEEEIIVSLLTQIGWRSRIQAIITQTDLVAWYEKALRGQYSTAIANDLLTILRDEIVAEFPSQGDDDLLQFRRDRGYDNLEYSGW